MTTMRSFRGSEGFSLAEVAVALLVVSIGILAAFGLFPSGLQAGRATLDETRAVLFADEVFNNYRRLAIAPGVIWADFDENSLLASAPLGNSLWKDPWDETRPEETGLAARVTEDVRINRYFPVGFPEHMEYAIRYVFETDIQGRLLQLRLWVWPGEFGGPDVGQRPTDVEKQDAPYFFYTEIFNHVGPETEPGTGPLPDDD